MLTVTLPGEGPQSVSVDLSATPSADDVTRLIGLCGIKPLARLAAGEWDADAVKAVVYLKLEADYEFAYSDFDVSFGELERFLTDPDLDIEAGLQMEPV